LHPVVKRNPALAVSEQLPESLSPPALDLEELLTAAHDIMHGVKERVTPAHGPERMAGEAANTTNTPDARSAAKSVMLRIATGCRADCVQSAGGEQKKPRESAEKGSGERAKMKQAKQQCKDGSKDESSRKQQHVESHKK
jgi:hypothetical protein